MRIDASLVIFLSIFLPTLTRTGSLAKSFSRAAPMLFAAICTWIANDINDRERDRINHPHRSLVSGRITPVTAAVLFFVSLAVALSTTYLFVEQEVAFWYYLVIILALSYGYIVELIPALKAPYVAAAMTLPIIVTMTSYPHELRLVRVALALFCFAFGKELCMDLMDRPGDMPSVLHRLPFNTLARMAFSLLIAGVLLLLTTASGKWDRLYGLGMLALLLVSVSLWFRLARYRSAIQILRIEPLAGLYYLL